MLVVSYDDEIERRLAIVSLRFGVSFDDARSGLVKQRIRALLDARDQLRRIPLANGDEPAPLFVVFDKERS